MRGAKTLLEELSTEIEALVLGALFERWLCVYLSPWTVALVLKAYGCGVLPEPSQLPLYSNRSHAVAKI